MNINLVWGSSMPWVSGKDFASKHNKKLHGASAQKAADVATALVNKGEDEGKAIRIANSVGDKAMKKTPKIKDHQRLYKKD